jgi:hypothetical protein
MDRSENGRTPDGHGSSDHDQIRQVLAKFIQLRDDHRFNEWGLLFTDDGTFQYGATALEGRTQIVEHVSNLLRADRGKHLNMNVVIDSDGDRATVTSDVVKLDPLEGKRLEYRIATMGRYEDELVRVDGRWHFKSRRVVIAGLDDR